MTKSQLPEITLTCGDGHSFTTRAAGGRSVRCKVCRRSKRVPMDRPTSERAAARERSSREPAPAPAPAAGSELAARWESEDPWPGSVRLRPGRAQDTCPGCSGPVQWEPGRTLVYCAECGQVALPAAVSNHYERQASHATARAEVAIADPMAEKAARARLRALRETAEDWLNQWLETIADDEMYDRVQWQRQARELSALLRGYIPEIRAAETEDELTAIKSHIVTEILNSEQGKALRAEWQESQDRAQRAYEARQRTAELEQRQREAEAEQREAEQAEREAARQAAIGQQRKTVQGRAERRELPPASPTGYAGAAVTVYGMVESWRKDREDRLAKYGACGYQHGKPAIAGRRYWITTLDSWGNQSGYELPNAPSAVVCKKHYAMADAWIEEQAAQINGQRGARVAAVYTELT